MSSLGSLESLRSIPDDGDIGIATFFWHIYNKGKYTDIEISIKDENDESDPVTFSAHRMVLSLWSPFFADELYGSHKMENIVEYEDVNPTAFKTMLRYMYGCYSPPKSLADACNLYKVAVKFQVVGLLRKLQSVVNQFEPNISNIFDLLEASSYMENKSMKDRCMKLIREKTPEILESYGPVKISPARLNAILDSPKLSLASEYDLLLWIYNWGKNRYVTFPEYSNVREALEEFLPKLHFTVLSSQEFAEFFKIHEDFLTKDEGLSILMNIASPGSWRMPEWHDPNAKFRVYSRRR